MRIIVVVEYFKIMNSCVNFIISIINYIVTNIRIFIGVSFVTYIITFHQNNIKYIGVILQTMRVHILE